MLELALTTMLPAVHGSREDQAQMRRIYYVEDTVWFSKRYSDEKWKGCYKGGEKMTKGPNI